MTARLDWVWIVGNHDAGFIDHCGGRIEEECEVGGIILRHEAVEGDPRPEMSGPFPSQAAAHLKGRNVSRRCFVASATKLILPAYGALTGGLDAGHPEIMKKVGSRRLGAGPGHRPAAALPDRRLGELRRISPRTILPMKKPP